MKEDIKLQEECLIQNVTPICKGMQLSRKIRWFVFAIILSLIFVMNMDQGIVSGTTSTLQKEFDITDEELGMLGSILFAGTTIGCLFTFTLINKFNRKTLLIIAVLLNIAALFSITQTTIYSILLISRFISGLTLSYIGIYSSVWCDQFGINKRRALMLSLIHIASPLGYIIGYVFGISLDWKATFYIQMILLLSHVPVMIFFTDGKYYTMILISQKCKNEGLNETIEKETQSDIEINKHDDERLDGETEALPKITKDDDEVSVFEEIINEEKVKNWKVECKKTWIELKVCFQSRVFVFTNITLFLMFFVISGIQFWINDYMETALLMTDKELRLIMFASVSITSPISGILLSGLLTTKIGGYEAKNSILIPLFSAIAVSILGNFVVLPDNYIVFSIFFWFYLFFGSACLPPLTGIILTSVPKEYAGSASSLSTFLFNVLGKFPAPYFYGVLKSYTDTVGEKFPLIILLNISFLCVAAIAFATKFQYARFKKIQETILLTDDFPLEKIEHNEKEIPLS